MLQIRISKVPRLSNNYSNTKIKKKEALLANELENSFPNTNVANTITKRLLVIRLIISDYLKKNILLFIKF